MSSESDRLLVEQIRARDGRAWQQLIDRYEGRLLAFVRRRLRDHAASEDVVQETFVGFIHSLPNFDESRELQSYLFSIASFKLTDHLRRSGRHPMQHVSDGPNDLLHEKPDIHAGASSLARSLERRSKEGEAVARGIAQLIGTWRERGDYERIKVLELLFVKGWKNFEVAQHLGVTDQHVANVRFAAIRKISELVQEAGLSPALFPELKQEAREPA